MIDGASTLAIREEVITAIDKALDEDPFPTRDTWGTSARAVEGQRAMMALFPAPQMPEQETPST